MTTFAEIDLDDFLLLQTTLASNELKEKDAERKAVFKRISALLGKLKKAVPKNNQITPLQAANVEKAMERIEDFLRAAVNPAAFNRSADTAIAAIMTAIDKF